MSSIRTIGAVLLTVICLIVAAYLAREGQVAMPILFLFVALIFGIKVTESK